MTVVRGPVARGPVARSQSEVLDVVLFDSEEDGLPFELDDPESELFEEPESDEPLSLELSALSRARLRVP